MKKMYKYISGLTLGVLAMLGFGSFAHAAADETLTTLTASSTSFLTDNLSLIMTFIASNFFRIVGAGLGILALYWIARKIYSLMRR